MDSSGNLYVADAATIACSNTPLRSAISSPIVGLSASHVFGQNGSFTTIGCNFGTALSAPRRCAFLKAWRSTRRADLYVSDTDNSRVLEFNQPLATPNMLTGAGDTVADKVFGQGGIFTTAVCNGGGVDADSLCDPRGLVTDPSGDLFVADRDNSRVLEFEPAAGDGRNPVTPGVRETRPRISFSARAAAARVSRPAYAPVRRRRRRRALPEYAIPPMSASTLSGNLLVADAVQQSRARIQPGPGGVQRCQARATSPRTRSSDKVRPAPISPTASAPTPPPATPRPAQPRCASRPALRWIRPATCTSPTRTTIACCVSTSR